MSIRTDALDALYAEVKPKGVTMTALLAKAVGVALASHPLLYATLAADGASIKYNDKARPGVRRAPHSAVRQPAGARLQGPLTPCGQRGPQLTNARRRGCQVNIAMAVALEGGLITPVLTDVANADLVALGKSWKELVGKARSKTLTSAEYSSGNFTISNLGMFGVDAFDAILPPGQGAILAVRASPRAWSPCSLPGLLLAPHALSEGC